MTAPMMPDPQQAAPPQPLQPPVPPPNPFPPRPNDGEILVATTYAKRLSKLVDPSFSAMDPLWQQPAIDCYNRAMQALTPPPVIPKGTVIQAKAGDAATLAAEEQAASTGKPPQQGGQAPQPQAPKIQTTGAAPSHPSIL